MKSKTKKTLILIISIVAILIVLGVGVYFGFFKNLTIPQPTQVSPKKSTTLSELASELFKDSKFIELRTFIKFFFPEGPSGPAEPVEIGNVGRENPFIPFSLQAPLAE